MILLALAACQPATDPEITQLVAALEAGEPEGRALATIGPQERDAIEPILELMARDDRRFVQSTCLEALLSAGAGDDALAAVERAMKHRDARVSGLAALAHWKITNSRSPGLDRLLRRAAGTPPDRFARGLLRRAQPVPESIAAELSATRPLSASAIATLGALGPAAKKALPDIEKALESPDRTTRIVAAEAHYGISGRLQPAVQKLAVEYRTASVFLRQRIEPAWMEMARDQPEAMARELTTMLDDESAAVREIAVIFLGELKASSARDRLVKMSKDDASENVRAAAQRILAKLGE
ncbi:MAG: HEAT repeat domain-containing protein [Planctomycetota bacterium]